MFRWILIKRLRRGVAQPGSALGSGPRGRRFKSYRPDSFLLSPEVAPLMECNIDVNKQRCNCSYDPCPRKGICCECISYHRRLNQLPACYFPQDIEKTYDRSVGKFLSVHLPKKG